ncbi:hypothetical protein EAI30_06655 [Romboutsia ilealis]|uniref:histidine kinase n=1 Tax=Romboutsia faecis TaxID=2764597 RepID=A0ABR7JPB8_9FIRM|nr:sensor histidine kinase [Romboutsia faecis]MBC5996766.1 hypothetical protein [Romboutsia faecis]MRN24293.1 hypothetical protein [Romboutsia ilealis]
MKNKLAIIIGVICFLIIISAPTRVLASEVSKINFEKLSVDEDLSNENVTSIFQDRKGYIWIGTFDGLNRYDGENIKVYNCDINNENTLSSTYITALEEDDCGNMWIGTDHGLDILNKDTDKVIRLRYMEHDKYRLGELRITSLLNSNYEDNIMWVGTENGLMKINIKSLEVKAFYHDEDDINSLTNSSITCLEEYKDGSIWVGTKYGVNVIRKDLSINQDTLHIYDEKSYIYNIEIDDLNKVWISTKGGILIYDINKLSDIVWIIDNEGVKQYSIKEKRIEMFAANKKPNNIDNNNFVLSDSQNNIWISSSNGIIKYSQDTLNYEIFNKDMNSEYKLTSNSISCFYEDRNGTIWIGTDKGVCILNYNKQFNYSDKDKNIVSILEDDKYLWVATKFDGIYIYDKSGKYVDRLYNINDELSLSNKYIKNLFKIGDRFIVIVTNKETISFDTENFSYQQHILKDGYSNELNYIYDDGEFIWVSATNGFYSQKIYTEERTYYNNNLNKFNITPYHISYILPDKNDDNIIWLGGVNIGLVKFHKENGVIKRYKHDFSSENSLINNYINCMIFDDLGNLWIGTNIGLSKLDIKTEKFTSYTTAEGLSNNFINSILIDDSDNLWISTNNGLNKFNIETEKIVKFSKMDGLQGYQFNLNSSFKQKNGIMIFGSTNGITYFNPDEIVKSKAVDEKVVIGDIYIGDNKVTYDGNELVLRYDDKNLYIDYFLPNYQNLNYITYEYMIEGIDSEWKFLDYRNYLDIESLESAKYTLKLRARDGHGNLTDETIMNIRVKQPIWKTPLAYLIYIIIGLALICYIINYVKILQHLVDQKTINLNKQLQENKRLSEEIIDKEKFKNNYFVNLSHELRTPINIIVSTVQLINAFTKDKVMTQEKTHEYMNMIIKSCDNLLKIIGDIIDSSKIETGEYKIYKKNNDIVYLAEETALNMSKFIEKKGISLVIDPYMEEKIISCDATEIERCIINLLGNAVKFTPEGGEIRLYIKEVEDYIEISVEDTGIGISKEDQDFIFKRFSQVEGTGATKASSSGIGLTLVKHIVELHGGYIRLESELNKGSKFTIGIPDVLECTEDNN